MKAVTFTLELLEPLMVTGLEGDPNSNVTLDYVPGSVIRGALIARYLRSKPKQYQFDPANKKQDERKLFFNGSVRYLNAYPLAKLSFDEIRTLPTPLSWFAEKDLEPTADHPTATAYDLCHKSAKGAFGKKQNKFLGKPFSCQDGKDIYLIQPEHRLAIHTQRERRHGRSMEDGGAIFRYESLETGSRFGGVILFEDDSLVNEIESLLKDKQLNLGGSRTAGYGRAKVSDWSKKTSWNEADEPSEIDAGMTFTITLLSNALIRDDNGQYQTELPLEDLKKHLADIKEAKLDDNVVNSSEEKFNATFKQTDIVGGFNRKWGLPLPQSISIKAGSVFTFKANEAITKDKVQALIEAGLGERRVEGFGRIAINLNTEEKLTWKKYEPENKAENQAITNGLSRGLAKQMVERLMRQKLDQKLLSLVANYQIKAAPPNHQISRIRAVVRDALRSGDKNTLKKFFNDNRRIAREHFEKARISNDNNDNLRKWIEERLEKLDAVFDFETPALGKNDPQYKTVIAKFTDDLKLEYHLRLIDGVLAHAAKSNG